MVVVVLSRVVHAVVLQLLQLLLQLILLLSCSHVEASSSRTRRPVVTGLPPPLPSLPLLPGPSPQSLRGSSFAGDGRVPLAATDSHRPACLFCLSICPSVLIRHLTDR